MELSVIERKIHEIRGCRVILDFELAALYEVETGALKRAVRRNIERFPRDFMFELTPAEYNSLRCQLGILESDSTESQRGKHAKYMPMAFTEQGVAMLSSVLRSSTAIKVNISIMRAFVEVRRQLSLYEDLDRRIAQLEEQTDVQFSEIYQALTELAAKKAADEKPRRPIGY